MIGTGDTVPAVIYLDDPANMTSGPYVGITCACGWHLTTNTGEQAGSAWDSHVMADHLGRQESST